MNTHAHTHTQNMYSSEAVAARRGSVAFELLITASPAINKLSEKSQLSQTLRRLFVYEQNARACSSASPLHMLKHKQCRLHDRDVCFVDALMIRAPLQSHKRTHADQKGFFFLDWMVDSCPKDYWSSSLQLQCINKENNCDKKNFHLTLFCV